MYKILVVEDEEEIRNCLKDILIENNYLVDVVQDGVSAIEFFKKKQPDLVILDLGLPKVTGESVLVEIKKTYSDLPVIILTAKNQTSDVIKGFNLGADDYIKKPFDL